MSGVAQRSAITGKRLALAVGLALTTQIRRYCYANPHLLKRIPRSIHRRFRLSPPEVGQRNIELGSGYRPTSGYVHVDIARRPHVEFLVRSHSLPFSDAWADGLLAVHMLEHVAPPSVAPTLREWHRVLRQ